MSVTYGMDVGRKVRRENAGLQPGRLAAPRAAVRKAEPPPLEKGLALTTTAAEAGGPAWGRGGGSAAHGKEKHLLALRNQSHAGCPELCALSDGQGEKK